MGAIKSVVGELQKTLSGKGRDIKQQTIIHFSMEKGMLITNQGQDFSYIIESFQQLKGRIS
jgi:hypothetical protein